MTGNVIMPEVDAVMHVLLSREKTSALHEISWYQWMYNILNEILHKLRPV